MKAFLPLLLIAFSVYAENINSLITKAYQHNPTIVKLERQISLKNYDIDNSTLYKNPVVTLGLNDINLEEPRKRNIEAMQTNYVTVSQEITSSDKLKYKQQIESTNKKIAVLFLQEQKDRIVKALYQNYFNYVELQQKISLNQEKINNIEKIKSYHTKHIQSNKAFQEILNNDLTIDQIKLQIIYDKEQQKQILIDVSQIVGLKVKDINLDNNNILFDNNSDLTDHKLLLIEKENINKQMKIKDLANENRSSDYTLSLGYYNRDSFDDYVSVSVKFPLNIYGKETNDLAKARKEIDVAHSKYDEVKNALQKRYDTELSKQQLSKRSLEYIEKINEHLEKEKQLITNKNDINSLIEVLMIENKIIANDIAKLKYTKQLQVANVELSYLTSHIQRLYHE